MRLLKCSCVNIYCSEVKKVSEKKAVDISPNRMLPLPSCYAISIIGNINSNFQPKSQLFGTFLSRKIAARAPFTFNILNKLRKRQWNSRTTAFSTAFFCNQLFNGRFYCLIVGACLAIGANSPCLRNKCFTKVLKPRNTR